MKPPLSSPAPARRLRLSAAALLSMVFLTTACAPRDFTNENDDLRRQNMELREQVSKLQSSIDLRLAQIQTLEQQASTTRPAVEGAQVPRVVAVRLARYSGALDTNRDGADDVLRLYAEPRDQLGRFLPMSGRAVVQAVAIRAGQPPLLLGEKTYEPKALDEAYRTGLTGTHYTLELPLPQPLPEGVNEVTAKLMFTDAVTGAELSAEQVFKLNRPPAGKSRF